MPGRFRIRWKSIIPAVGVVAGVVASPEVTALLPDKWAHAVIAISGIVGVLVPALVTDRPRRPRAARPVVPPARPPL